MKIDPERISTRNDLRAALKALHEQDGRSYHQVAADSGVAVASVNAWIKQGQLPRWSTLRHVLKTWGVPPTEINPWQMALKRATVSVGKLLAAQLDPFEYEVHQPIAVAGAGDLPPLPPYISRDHDIALADTVQRVICGASEMVVLVGGSSTGKTAALWEALTPLRATPGWRLWHPWQPTRRQAFHDSITRVGPRTVLWLNETQEYLSGPDAEHAAAALHDLLSDASRAPVLVLGTLWRSHHKVLCCESKSSVSKLLNSRLIAVPESFSGHDPAAIRDAADRDPRIAAAVNGADDNQITQFLAGGPELVNRYRFSASPAAKAAIEAAMDAVRMGHTNSLSYDFLHDAAPYYLTDNEWGQVTEGWLDRALAETNEPCKGTLGPLARIRPRPSEPIERKTPAVGSNGVGAGVDSVRYRLADFLDQYGRNIRSNRVPPSGFWTAATRHARPDDLYNLGQSAWKRGLYRTAAQFWKNATCHGNDRALYELLRQLKALQLPVHRPLAWLAREIPVDQPGIVASLLNTLCETGATDQIATLLDRNPGANSTLDNPHHVAFLLTALRNVGASDQISTLLARNPAEYCTLDREVGVRLLMNELNALKAADQVAILALRAIEYVVIENAQAVSELLATLHQAGAEAQITALLIRNPAARVPIDQPRQIAQLLTALGEVGADDQIAMLLARDPVGRARLQDPYVVELLDALDKLGADAEVKRWIARNFVQHIPVNHPDWLSFPFEVLNRVGAEQAVIALAQRAVECVPLTGYAVGDLLEILQTTEQPDHVAALLARNPAEHIPLTEPYEVAFLLYKLRDAGADEHVEALLTRNPAELLPLDNVYDIGDLLYALREIAADEQFVALANRAAKHAPLSRPFEVANLLHVLSESEMHAQIATLLKRDPAGHSASTDPYGDGVLAIALKHAGADAQVADLAGRLPLSGGFDHFMAICNDNKRFRFGVEPDTMPSAPWAWDDLE
ncbi:ATP-binding protein [Nocardia testacea]|uniref:ATP-binding protein n=1 Tax=Nocardia testacea TaxID=248551 RepID=UPI0012F640AB|nr:ATP-binding protein [Nocardia testacea]